MNTALCRGPKSRGAATDPVRHARCRRSTKGASTRRHSMAIPKRVGCVAALWRYPVKSMAAEALEHAQVSWHGLPGDRRWAFIRKGAVTSGFPWLTIRERPDLWRYRPSFVRPDLPDKSRT